MLPAAARPPKKTMVCCIGKPQLSSLQIRQARAGQVSQVSSSLKLWNIKMTLKESERAPTGRQSGDQVEENMQVLSGSCSFANVRSSQTLWPAHPGVELLAQELHLLLLLILVHEPHVHTQTVPDQISPPICILSNLLGPAAL